MTYEPFIPSVFSANARLRRPDLTALASLITVGQLIELKKQSDRKEVEIELDN